MTYKYTLTPKGSFVGNADGTLDMLTEATAVLGILTDEHRFPGSRANLAEYFFRRAPPEIRVSLRAPMRADVRDFFEKYWNVVLRTTKSIR